MCLICVEWEKGKLTFSEAIRNLGEMSQDLGEEHVEEVKKKLIDTLSKQYEALRDEIQGSGYGYLTPDIVDESIGIIPPDDTASD